MNLIAANIFGALLVILFIAIPAAPIAFWMSQPKKVKDQQVEQFQSRAPLFLSITFAISVICALIIYMSKRSPNDPISIVAIGISLVMLLAALRRR
jgi:hypothetical protein